MVKVAKLKLQCRVHNIYLQKKIKLLTALISHILYLLQSFFSDFNKDDKSDALFIPKAGRRSLALGDAAGTFLVLSDYNHI